MATNEYQSALDKVAMPDEVSSVAPTLYAPSDTTGVEPDTSFVNFVKLWAKTDSTPNAAARFLVEGQIPSDPNFRIEDLPAADRDEIFKGFPQDTVDNLYYNSRSLHDLYFLAGEARQQAENEQKLAEYGGWGTTGRFVGALADPTNLALMVGTGGLGAVAKAEQIGNAVRIAASTKALAPLAEEVASLGTAGSIRRIAYGSTGAALENAAITAGLNSNNANKDGTDVVHAALAGFALHSTFSIGGRVYANGRVNDVVRLYKDRMDTLQLAEGVAENRTALVSSLVGGEAAARADEGQLQGRVGAFLASNNGPTEGYADFRRVLESGGDASARSSTSTATGADQFLEKTWLSTVEQAKPAWAEGLSRDEILAQRTNAERSGEMAQFLDAQNASALERAGAPVNNYTLYAAHHFGPSRAVKFAKAADDALMDDLFPEAVLKANPYLRGKTKAEVVSNWTERARKGGVDTDAMLGRSGVTDAEGYRTAQVTDFSTESMIERVRQADEAEAGLRDLDFTASTALKQGARRKLERAIEALEANTKALYGTARGARKAEIERVTARDAEVTASAPERLRAAREQDAATYGADVDADTVVRLRRRSVRDSIRQERAPILERLAGLRRADSEDLKATQADLANATQQRAMDDLAVAARGEARRVRADQPRRDNLRAALGLRREIEQTAARRETLGKLDANDTVAQGLAEANAGPSFGTDTLSAARAIGYSDELYPNASGTGEVVPRARMSGATNLKNRGTLSGILRGSEFQAVRDNFGLLVGNIFGNVDGSAVREGASEISSTLQRRYMADFSKGVDSSYGKWMTEQGIPKYRYYDRQVRAQFMDDVGRHVRGEASDSPAVASMAGRVTKLFADVLTEAKRAGVQGFDNVEVNAGYLPRVFNFQRFGELEERFGSDQLSTLISQAMKEANPELSDEIAAKAGAHYIQKMREMRVGNDPGVLTGMSFDDIGYLRQFLQEAGVLGDELEETVARFAEVKLGERAAKGEGSFRNAKRRAKFDENFALDLRVRGGDGSLERVRVSDLLDNNVEGLVGRYVRTVSGHTALAHIGIKSAADWTGRVKAVKNALEGHEDADRILKAGQGAYDLITGKPLEEAGFWSELMRTTRDITYATQMENAGLANLPDLGALLAHGNLRYTFRHIMNLGELFRRGEDGQLKSELWREQEEWLGVGTDYLNNTVFSSYDVAGAATLGRSVWNKAAQAASTVGHAARVTGRAVTVGSGMAGLNAFSQRVVAQNILLRMKDDLFDRGGFSAERMAALGIDAPMGKRIAAQMKEHTEWAEGELGGKIRKVNWANWTDLEARDRMLNGVVREARKSIQEEDLGDTFLWQHKNLAKFLLQFRRFGITAYSKQFLRSLNERDAETVTRNAMALALAGAAYYAKTEAQLQGMQVAGVDSDKIEKWKKEYMGGGAMARAAVRNSGFMFLLPDAVDSFTGPLLGQTYFDYRNSGNSSNAASVGGSVPGFAMAANVGNAAGGVSQAILRGDRQYKQKDLRALQAVIPFGNHLAVAPLFQAFAQDLPETDDDTDKEHAEWFWQ